MSKKVEKYNYRVVIKPMESDPHGEQRTMILRTLLSVKPYCAAFDVSIEHDTKDVCGFCGDDWIDYPAPDDCCCEQSFAEWLEIRYRESIQAQEEKKPLIKEA